MQSVREEVALLQRGGDRLTPLVERLELGETIADRGDRHFVERARCLLAVARHKWDGAALAQQFGSGANLARPERQLARDLGDMQVVQLSKLIL